MSSKGKQQVVSGIGRELAIAIEGSIAAAKDAAVQLSEKAAGEAQVAARAAEAARDKAQVAARAADAAKDVAQVALKWSIEARDKVAVFADAVDVRARSLRREVLRLSLAVAGAVLLADALVALLVCRLCLQ